MSEGDRADVSPDQEDGDVGEVVRLQGEIGRLTKALEDMRSPQRSNSTPRLARSRRRIRAISG